MKTARGFVWLPVLLAILGVLVVGGGVYVVTHQNTTPQISTYQPATNTPANTPARTPAQTTGAAQLVAAPTSGKAPLTVSFSTTYSYPKNYSGSTGLSITFGDGTGGSITAGNIVKHRYSTPGIFTTKLIGCSLHTDLLCEPATLGTVIITVTGSAAAVGATTFTAAPTSGNSPLAVHFAATDPVRYDPDGVYSIDYGDSNSGPTGVKALCSSATCTISTDHTYNVGGIFTPTLFWTAGCHAAGGDCALINEDIVTTKVSVSGQPGTATMTASPLSGGSGTKIIFDIKGSGGPFTLDFGDNSSPYVINYLGNNGSDSTSHAYVSWYGTDASHTYTAKLTSSGATLSTVEITIRKDGCDLATAQYLSGQITPHAWHVACGTTATYNESPF